MIFKLISYKLFNIVFLTYISIYSLSLIFRLGITYKYICLKNIVLIKIGLINYKNNNQLSKKISSSSSNKFSILFILLN